MTYVKYTQVFYSLLNGWIVANCFVDVNYFLRVLFHGVAARFLFRKLGYTDSSTIYGICLTSDIDTAFIHMNNARYLREFDFGRLTHGFQTRFLEKFVLKSRSTLVLSGVTVRFRLPLRVFMPYKVVTRSVSWHNQFMYMEQKIISLADGIVRAVSYSIVAASKNIEEHCLKDYPHLGKPPLPEDFQKWLESREISRNSAKI